MSMASTMANVLALSRRIAAARRMHAALGRPQRAPGRVSALGCEDCSFSDSTCNRTSPKPDQARSAITIDGYRGHFVRWRIVAPLTTRQ
jgi:hypothetical protein